MAITKRVGLTSGVTPPTLQETGSDEPIRVPGGDGVGEINHMPDLSLLRLSSRRAIFGDNAKLQLVGDL